MNKLTHISPDFLERMCIPSQFKSFRVKLKGGAPLKIKLQKSRIYTVTNVEYSKFFKSYTLRIGNNDYSAQHFYKVVDQPDHSVTDQFQPEPIHPDNQTVKTLIQYVSDHREAMTKESILHFANLIGLIKLGAL